MARWLGIDHGTRRIGLAVGSTEDGIASPIAVLEANDDEILFAEILRSARDYHVVGLVVGWPLNMDDTEGPQGKLARNMAVRLAEQTGLDVRLWDERLSSFAADRQLAGHLTRKKRKARQDALAAAQILKHFFGENGPALARRASDIVDDEKHT